MEEKVNGWAVQEFETVGLDNKRLNKEAEAIFLAERLSASPATAIPKACGSWAETAAAYRFFNQESVPWQDIMSPHWHASLRRIRACEVVLCLQDTTELKLNGQEIDGLGPLPNEIQHNMYVHTNYAVTPQREPLGVLDTWMWARSPKNTQNNRAHIKKSTRWIEGYEQVAELAQILPPTRMVYVANQESDIMDLMVKAHEMGHPADWLIGVPPNKTLPQRENLWDQLTCGQPLGKISFTLPARPNQKARVVTQQVWAHRVQLPCKEGPKIEVTGIVAHEVNVLNDLKPIEWRLLTNRHAHSVEDVTELLDWYRARWDIDLFFQSLKCGCRAEALQRVSLDRIERALAFYMVVAWRITRLIHLGHTCPDLNAEAFFEKDEWRAVYILNQKKPPPSPPPLNEIIQHIAMLGGLLGEKMGNLPDATTLWFGIQRLTEFVVGLELANLSE